METTVHHLRQKKNKQKQNKTQNYGGKKSVTKQLSSFILSQVI